MKIPLASITVITDHLNYSKMHNDTQMYGQQFI